MKLKLVEKIEEILDVISFIFKPPRQVSFKAGQFMRYNLSNPQPDERGTSRFFTIASSPFEKKLMITTRFANDKGSSFKESLKKMAVGQEIEAEGPFGSFIIPDEFISEGKKLCFVAGGIGITPFRSILLQLDYEKKPFNITLLYASRDQNIVFKDLFDNLSQNHPGFKVYYIIDPQRIDENTFKSLVPDFQTNTYYVSGPAPMVKGIEETLEDLGIERDNILHDYFPGYSKI